MSFDVVVVGGGVSGAGLALVLGRLGRRVALVEAAGALLPLVRGFVREGLHFDTGFHYTGGLGPGGILARYFDCLGLSGLSPLPLDPEGFDRLRFLEPAFELCLPCGQARIRERLGAAFPAERGAIEAYLAAIDRAVAASPFLNPGRPLPQTLTFEASGPTLAGFLDGLGAGPLLAAVLSLHCLLHGTPPGEILLSDHARVVAGYHESAHGLAGGGAALARSFEQALAAQGTSLHLGREAQAIVLSPAGAVAGVRLTGGEVLSAPAVAAAIHPRRLLGLVPEGVFRPAYRRRLQNLPSTPSASVLFGVLSGDPGLLAGKNLLLSPGIDVEAHFSPRTPPERRALYVTCGLEASADGRRAIEVIAPDYPSPAQGEDDKAERLARLEARFAAACPELAPRVRFVDGATPRTFARLLNDPDGGLYGVRHAAEAPVPLPLTRLPGLFLSGQNVLAPGVLGAVVSAFVTASLMCGPEPVRRLLEKAQ